MADLLDKIWGSLDPMVIMLIIAAGYFQHFYIPLQQIGKVKIISAWKTLFIGSLFSLVYILIDNAAHLVDAAYIKKVFFSYVFATSFYELILGPITKWIQAKVSFGKNDTPPTP